LSGKSVEENVGKSGQDPIMNPSLSPFELGLARDAVIVSSRVNIRGTITRYASVCGFPELGSTVIRARTLAQKAAKLEILGLMDHDDGEFLDDA
jgi:hypothetical protein